MAWAPYCSTFFKGHLPNPKPRLTRPASFPLPLNVLNCYCFSEALQFPNPSIQGRKAGHPILLWIAQESRELTESGVKERSWLYSSLHAPSSPLHFAITRGQKDRKAYIFLSLQLIWSVPKGFLYFVLPQFPGPSSSELSFSIIPQLLCLIKKINYSIQSSLTAPISKWTCLLVTRVC